MQMVQTELPKIIYIYIFCCCCCCGKCKMNKLIYIPCYTAGSVKIRLHRCVLVGDVCVRTSHYCNLFIYICVHACYLSRPFPFLLGLNSFTEAVKKPAVPQRVPSRQVIPTARATSISILDDLAPSPPPAKGVKGTRITPSPPPGKPSSPKGELPPPRTPVEIRQSLSAEMQAMEMPAEDTCTHSHEKAGQELCYLCHQRAVRNVPVSFESERRRKEQEQDRLLQQFQHMKDTEAILRDQVISISIYLSDTQYNSIILIDHITCIWIDECFWNHVWSQVISNFLLSVVVRINFV